MKKILIAEEENLRVGNDEFLELFKQVKELQFSKLNSNDKTEVGLTEQNKTIPFEDISNNAPDCYYMDSEGFRPSSSDLKDFTEYPYKNESERIKVVRRLNKNIQKLIDKDKKARIKLSQAEIDLQIKKEKNKEKALKEIERLNKQISPPRSLFSEYPVLFTLKWNTKNFKTTSIKLDNNTLYNLCLHDKEKTITARWNKTVLEHYEDKKAKKYETYLEPFYEWFEDRDIDVEEVDSLIKTEKESSKESEKPKSSYTYKDHSNYKDLGAVSKIIVNKLSTIDKIKHRSLKDFLDEAHPELDVDYTQSLSQSFRNKANKFYKDEIGHTGGYWFLKNK